MSPRSASHQQASEPYGQARDRHDDDRYAHRAAHRHIPHDEPPGRPAPDDIPPASPDALPSRRTTRSFMPDDRCGSAGRILDLRRHAGDHGGLVGGVRDLFRLPRRRAHAPDRAQAEMQFALRGPYRGDARASRPRDQPPAARSGPVRASARPALQAAGRVEARASSLGAWPIRRHGAIKPNARSPGAGDSPAAPPKPSPISDKAVFTAPPDREARFELRGAAPSASRRKGPRPAAAWRRARGPAGFARPVERARHGRSTRSRKATTPRSSACAACWPSWASAEPRNRRARPVRALPARVPPPTRSSGKSTASAWRGASRQAHPHHEARCRSASRSRARSI